MASSSSARHYEVFLSFRGEDTRKGFVSHLYDGLQRMGILTFKDDRELPLGGSLTFELPKAIEESKIAVVVISQNYASSRWCLKELQVIMERHKEGTLTVIPIFYGVDPSHVRNMRENFAVALQKYEGKEKSEDIKKWRDALREIGGLTGVDSRNCQDEATMVRNIVGDISKHLFRMSPEDTSDIFGMDAHFEGLAPLLNMGSDDKPRMIGIWGMGGVGKTTIAKCLYSTYKCQFPFHCFIENIKKFYDDHGREKLQRHFLSKIFCDESLKSDTYEVNSNTLKDRLRGLKVLVIFDDVDKLDQLEALAKEADWFGPGSRIIITTRDKGLQISSDMGLYEVKCLGEEVALKLFNHFAFGEAFSKDEVPNGLAGLSSHASSLVQGLPLALKVLGSFLRGRGIDEWKAAISRLIGSSRKTVMECLRVSYHGLDGASKDIFVTVACLVSRLLNCEVWSLTSDSNGEHISRLVQLLDGEERKMRCILDMLAEKALIDISNDGRVTIHDLIKEMAEDIVYEQSPNEPGRRKFLWDAKEVYDVLEDGTGTDAIEGISVDFSRMEEYPTRNGALESMRNLKFLIMWDDYDVWIDSSKIHGVFNHLPRKLKLLYWPACPLTALPSSFKGEYLVELCLHDSNLDKLSEGTVDLRNLKKMDFRCCKSLKEIPGLCGATKLEELYLPGVLGMKDTIYLEMKSPSWEYRSNGFLRSIMPLKSLKVLNLPGWKSLTEVPKSIQNFSALRELDLGGCENLRDIPYTIGELTGLKELDLSRCAQLKTIPDTIGSLTALEILNLAFCSSLLEIPNRIGGLTSLRYLFLIGCKNLKDIPDTIGELTGLKELSLSGCAQLKTIPDTIGSLTALEFLSLAECSSLLEIPNRIGDLTSLRELDLSRCENLKDIPYTIGELAGLETLDLSGCAQLETIPDTIGELTGLETLDLSGCAQLETIPDTIGELTGLETLDLSGCAQLHTIPDTIGSLTALEFLGLAECSLLLETSYHTGDFDLPWIPRFE